MLRRECSKKGSEVERHSESIVSASEGTCNHSLHILNLSINDIVLPALWA